jgi:hypothetical protein
MKTVKLLGVFNRRVYWPKRVTAYGEPSVETKEEAHKLFVASYPELPYHHQDLPHGGYWINDAPTRVEGNHVIWEIKE